MQAQMFNFPRIPLIPNKEWKEGMPEEDKWMKNADGTYQHGEIAPFQVQGSLRPVQFYEYVFPKDGLKQVDGKFVIDEDRNLKEVLAMIHWHDQVMRPEMKPIAWIIRKALHGEKVPEFPELKGKENWQITSRVIPNAGMAVYPCGIKKDVIKDWVNYGSWQEGV